MVAKIKTGKNIRGILVYNENKVASGEASLILANGFAADISKLDFNHKLHRFQHLTKLKPTVKTNALHISLNFHTSEILDKAKIQKIAMAYMERIGFAEQPYLVYQHFDAAHAHIHIATTSIQRDGASINLHNLGRTSSEKARKSIEQDFRLHVAERKDKSHAMESPGLRPVAISYGKAPTKRSLSNVISLVMTSYHYSSFAEYSAVLKHSNISADRGDLGSNMYEKKGLQYAVLDDKGQKIGVPIKASSFYSKPTLLNLEKRFTKNNQVKALHRKQLEIRVLTVLDKYKVITPQTLLTELARDAIILNLHRNTDGFVYGATFIDQRTKSVYKGSELGKAFSAAQLRQGLGATDQLRTFLKPANRDTYLSGNQEKDANLDREEGKIESGAFLNAPGTFEEQGMLKKKRKKIKDYTQEHKM